MQIDRRTAIKWVVAASAALHAPNITFAAESAALATKGYGKDPDLLKAYHAGDLWPLTLTAPQRRLAAVLCDMMIPPEGTTPGASAVGVVDFIDEWISSPYPVGARDKPIVLDGFRWLDEQSRSKSDKDFADITAAQRASICDPLIATPVASPLTGAAAFFMRYRDLTAIGFYTTPVGMNDLGYRGNVPLARFDGPPKELLAKLGL